MSTQYPLVSVVIPSFNRKEKLARLIRSIMDSNYPKDKLEIIVVDDVSTDGTYENITNLFPQVKVIRNERKRLVAASRNIGFKNSKGYFIFFVDDDNVVDKSCIHELVKVMLTSKAIGVVAPVMYYFQDPEIIWCAGVKRSMVTGKTFFVANGQTDRGQFNRLSESDDFPNSFMVRREIMEIEHILFDEKTFQWMYEESDFCYRIKKNGWKVVLVPHAKIYHDTTRGKNIGLTKIKAYYLARNRILFHRKYSGACEFPLFMLFFNPFITLFYTISFLRRKKYEELKHYLRGVFDGIRMVALY